MKFHLFIYFTIYFLGSAISLNAQSTTQEEAIELFDKENYKQALPLFNHLVAFFPKDAKYQYYAGICLVQTNSNLKLAEAYLTFAANSSQNIPSDVYFFLGRTMHLQYKFEGALQAYQQFQKTGNRSLKEKLQCDMNINMVRNAKTLLDNQCIINVYKVDTVNINKLFDFYNSLLKTGKFTEKSEKIFSFKENKYRNTWRFIPFNADKNTRVFESEYNGLIHKDKDIVSIRKISPGEWSSPVNLGNNINSPYDEEYPYYYNSEHTLYFSSKGHNSIGGYDIFKSEYDSVSNTWSAALNLGYPVNTPYDDFLFVPSEDKSQAYFCSNRDTHDDRIEVYTIKYSQNYPTIKTSANTDFISVANLTPVLIIKKPIVRSTVKSSNYSRATMPLSDSYPKELLNQGEYNRYINLAMQYQLQSDSLGRVAENMRQRIPAIKSETERDQLKKAIYTLDKKSEDMQNNADVYYGKARQLEKKYSSKDIHSDSAIYSGNNKIKEAFKKNTDNLNEQNSQKQNNKDQSKESGINVNEFAIMDKPYYSTLDQVPVNPPVINGLVYRIQLGVFSQAVDPKNFKGMVPVIGESLQNGATKFYTGLFRHLSDAEKALNKVHELGFKDAFIVSFYNGIKIPSNRAKEIEMERP